MAGSSLLGKPSAVAGQEEEGSQSISEQLPPLK